MTDDATSETVLYRERFSMAQTKPSGVLMMSAPTVIMTVMTTPSRRIGVYSTMLFQTMLPHSRYAVEDRLLVRTPYTFSANPTCSKSLRGSHQPSSGRCLH